jgi:hypothetical protein
MTRLLEDMTEPEIREYLNLVMAATKSIMTDDVIGFMLIIFQRDGISQYAASIEPEGAIDSLRKVADLLEQRETVKR